MGGFAGVGRFVDGGREDGERESGGVENLCAAGGSGGEDEFHGVEATPGDRETRARILHSGSGIGLCSSGVATNVLVIFRPPVEGLIHEFSSDGQIKWKVRNVPQATSFN